MGKFGDDLYSAADVFGLLGIQYGSQKNARVVCPKCRKKDFYMNMEKNMGHCYRASCDFRGNQISYYAETKGISTKEANKEIMSLLGIGSKANSGNNTSFVSKKLEFAPELDLAPIDDRNNVYTALTANLGLSEAHRRDLRRRGLTDTEIDRLNYFTYPYKSDLVSTARKLVSQGFSLKGIPGFYLNENNDRALRPLKHGFAFPYRDYTGRIQGYQLRKDDKLLKVFIDEETGEKRKEKKCNWISSNGFKEGTGCTSFVHFACDFIQDFMTDVIRPWIGKDGVLYITEGAVKADIIHIITGWPVIAVPGVNGLSELEKLLPYLKQIGVKKIVNLFDMDYLTNENVQKAQKSLEQMVRGAGMDYERETWETEVPNHKPLKGYDDYLVYHKRGI